VDERWVWCTVNKVEVTNPKHQKGQVQREEEQEERDGRFQRADQEDEGENEPALSAASQLLSLSYTRKKGGNAPSGRARWSL
jgi:hypothetical protein